MTLKNGLLVALVLVLMAPFGILIGAVVVLAPSLSQNVCGATGAALDVANVPDGPVAGYGHDQLVNAAQIMKAAAALGLTVRDQEIGVMTAMGESGLRVIDYGDAVGPDSRGLFQQRDNGAWGSYADRMDPFISATNFFKALTAITDRASLDPTIAAHRVQRNADPYYYAKYWDAAVAVVAALTGTGSTSSSTSTSSYALGHVQPETATVANTLGPMFAIKTIGGYRDPGSEQYDPNGHPAGLALDFMIDDISNGVATGQRLADYVVAHAADLDVKYVIWQQHIWSTERADEGWRAMADRGSPTANHMDHVHVSLTGTGTVTASTSCSSTSAAVGASGWALPASGPITDPYGPRINPITGQAGFHHGVDIGASCSAPIHAAASGTVVRAGAAAIYGNLIELDHGNGVRTRYGHMYVPDILVSVGDQVQAGQVIARVGSAGNSTGCHLHFEVLLNGSNVEPVAYLAAQGVHL